MNLTTEGAGISPDEWSVRCELAACYRLVAMFGWDDLLANHLTARVPREPGCFLINPFGLMFDEVTASNLVKIDDSGEPMAPTPYGVNRTGFVIHSAIHQARPDAECVIHLHTVDGVAVSMTDTGLLPLNQTAMTIVDDLATHEYEGLALDLDERARLADDLGDKHLMLLHNHGTLTLGRTVGEAFLRTYLLEWACRVQNLAFATGQPMHAARPEVVGVVRGQLGSDGIGGYAAQVWSALLRRVDRLDPGYRA